MVLNDMNEVLEFINRRFKKDCNWVDGNCYYFAIILKDRFPEGKIFYDVVLGHFVFLYKDEFYDWEGVFNPMSHKYLVEWDKFDEYDSSQKKVIVKYCVM